MRINYTVLYLFLATISVTPTIGQFNVKLALGTNITSINNGDKDSYYVSEFPREVRLTGGLEAEYSLRRGSLKPGFLSFASGVYYLRNGYADNYFFDFFGTELGFQSNFNATYLQVPMVVRYNIQPLPLVEKFTIFFGVGVSNNLLLKAELKETNKDIPCIGCSLVTYEDEGDITEYGRKISHLANLEAGFAFKRIQFMVRHKRSLNDVYFKNLEGNWGVPAESSHYMLLHNQTGKLSEIHWELLLAYRLF